MRTQRDSPYQDVKTGIVSDSEDAAKSVHTSSTFRLESVGEPGSAGIQMLGMNYETEVSVDCSRP